MANLVKTIKEKGIVLGKHINEAREAGESFDGKLKWNARDKEFVLNVISCDEEDFSKETGFNNATRLEFVVDEETYNKAKFLTWCNVKYTLQNGEKEMRPKPVSIALIENSK